MSLDIDAVTRIAAMYPHIPGWALPSPRRHAQWVEWVLWADGCDDDGNLLGWCPLHDPQREREGSAEFNFLKGVMRCQGDPRCHDRRAVSLDTVIARWEGRDAD
jgi:hypothetical protein